MYVYKKKNTGRIVTSEAPLDWKGYEAVTEEKDTANDETAVSEAKKEQPKKRTVKK